MNKKALSLLLLPIFALTLSSCREDISTLYKGGEYTSSNLKENYYTVYPDNLKKLEFPKLSFDLKDSQFTATSSTFSQVMNTSLSFIDVSVTGFNNGGSLSAGYGVTYGGTYRLGLTLPSVNYGFTSRLFDGQTVCGGDGPASYFASNQSGFGLEFGKECSYQENLLIFARHGTGFIKDNAPVAADYPRTDIRINLNVTLYAYYPTPIAYTFTFSNITIMDAGGSAVTMYGVNIPSIFGTTLGRIKAMSIDYNYVYDPFMDEDKYIEERAKYDEIDRALLLYEVMLPGSTWN